MEIRGEYLLERNAYRAYDETLIFHCHHYNTYLQTVIEDAAGYLDVYPVLVDSAQEIVHHQLQQVFKDGNLSVEDKKKAVEDYYRFNGFGKLDLTSLDESGGVIKTKSDHYAQGWLGRYGARAADLPGVSFFSRGFIAGALEVIFNKPLGYFECSQESCIAKGDEYSTFTVSVSKIKRNLQESPGLGVPSTGIFESNKNSEIDSLAIRDALINMPIEGDANSGLID